MKEYTTYWIKHFKENPEYCQIRLKKLDKGFNGYPPFDLDESNIDVVDLETFIKTEKHRLQLFIGIQMGLHPLFYNLSEFYNENKIIVVLGKSVLSGHVAGLRLYKVDANSKNACLSKKQEIRYFKNEK